VTFAGQQNQVARHGGADGEGNRRLPVMADFVFRSGALHPTRASFDDGHRSSLRGLSEWHHEVAAAAGSLAHQGTPWLVAVAAATETR